VNSSNLELMVKIFDAFKEIILGGAGGIVAYLFDFQRQKKALQDIPFSFSAMFINMCIGAFVAYTLGSFIDHTISGRDGYIGLIGVTSYAILGIVESRFAKIIIDRILGGGDGK